MTRRPTRRTPGRTPDASSALRRLTPWIAVGTFVASTTLGAARRPERLDARLRIIDDAVRRSGARVDLVQAPAAARQADGPPLRRFDIPAGPLDGVIRAFERASGFRIVLAVDSIGSIQSPGVSGTFTAQQALAALLEGTSVAFRMTGPDTATLELRIDTEAVSVTARAPETNVSMPKYTQPLREIPQTIEVIPRAAMEQQGVTTLSEALRNVPGITLQAGEGGGASNTAGDMFNMRGFNAANSLFVDGVRDDGLISRDVFNLEQVEVFMGPTGSDVGRGTAAGYVNMETKTPHLPAATSGAVSYGSADQRRATIDLNVPLSRDARGGWLAQSALRVNGLWQDSGVPGRDVAALRSRAVAPSFALGLDTPTRVVVAGQFVRQDNQPDYGIPGAAWPGDPLTPTTVRADAPVDQTNYYGSLDFDYDRAAQQSALARVEHDLSPRATLRNQTRYNAAHREAVITSIGNVAAFNPATDLVTLSRQGNERDNSILSNQTTLTDRFTTGRLRHSANAGLEFTHERQFAPALGGVGTRAPVDIFSPNPRDPVTGYAVARTGASSEGWTNTIALYGFDTVELAPRWQLSGGLRLERYDTQFRAVDATGATTTDEGARDTLVSGKAGLLFKASERGNLYVSYGSTVTPPGTANFTLSAQANNQNNPNVEPQASTNLEGGVKWDASGGRLSLTGSIFHTVNENVIFTVDATAVPPIYNQDDRQRVNGISVGASGRILQQWSVLANFSYLDTAADSQNPANDGKRLTLTPAWSGGVWTTYQLPRRVTIGGGVRATDSVFINSANTISSPGYHLVDALAEYAVNAHLSMRLNVYNLTDEVYIRNVNNNGGRYNPGSPRSALLTAAIRF